ncbi:protein SPT2 homolog isoform X2 [Sciurus carolinensis]|uniref:protein SPT2 homolog isoform X2 n=1 Tax=Sciurus carolinensis TaxID=30640 RepID=UPI001FB3EFE1|nr:protein SPT2 homolog isoform X2 [Sciurus carolinensis]
MGPPPPPPGHRPPFRGSVRPSRRSGTGSKRSQGDLETGKEGGDPTGLTGGVARPPGLGPRPLGLELSGAACGELRGPGAPTCGAASLPAPRSPKLRRGLWAGSLPAPTPPPRARRVLCRAGPSGRPAGWREAAVPVRVVSPRFWRRGRRKVTVCPCHLTGRPATGDSCCAAGRSVVGHRLAPAHFLTQLSAGEVGQEEPRRESPANSSELPSVPPSRCFSPCSVNTCPTGSKEEPGTSGCRLPSLAGGGVSQLSVAWGTDTHPEDGCARPLRALVKPGEEPARRCTRGSRLSPPGTVRHKAASGAPWLGDLCVPLQVLSRSNSGTCPRCGPRLGRACVCMAFPIFE